MTKKADFVVGKYIREFNILKDTTCLLQSIMYDVLRDS